jgi:hypothetical protein
MAVVLVEDEQRMLDMVGSIQNAANNPGTNGSQAKETSLASTTVFSPAPRAKARR